jgi:hypothetical protein
VSRATVAKSLDGYSEPGSKGLVADESVPYEAVLAEDRGARRWSRCSRFLFIVSAAALCWLVPGLAIYFLVGLH